MRNRKETDLPEWAAAGYDWYPLGMAMRKEFGEPIWKISVDAHFSCPNIDGTVGRGGCIFCDAVSFSPSRRFGLESITEQIDHGIQQLTRRYNAKKFIAYFQPSTNTHGTPEYLESVYRCALSHPAIVGLAIGTRPDALPDPVLDMLERIGRETWLSLEIGLQSAKNETLRFLNRGHDYETFVDAVARAKQRSLRLGVHVILGLPGETDNDMRRTATLVAAEHFHSIKLHHLYVVRDTKLAQMWHQGEIQTATLAQYASWAVDFLERQDPESVIDRVSGEMSADFLLAPDWTCQKHAARNAINQEFKRRGSRQGLLFEKNPTKNSN